MNEDIFLRDNVTSDANLMAKLCSVVILIWLIHNNYFGNVSNRSWLNQFQSLSTENQAFLKTLTI